MGFYPMKKDCLVYWVLPHEKRVSGLLGFLPYKKKIVWSIVFYPMKKDCLVYWVLPHKKDCLVYWVFYPMKKDYLVYWVLPHDMKKTGLLGFTP